MMDSTVKSGSETASDDDIWEEQEKDSIQLFARIKKSSKYFGQTESGALFKVTLTDGYSESVHSVSGNFNYYRYAVLTFS